MDSGLQVVNSHSTSSCACAASRARNEASILLGFALSSNWCEIADDRDGRTTPSRESSRRASAVLRGRTDGGTDGPRSGRQEGATNKGGKELESFPGSVRVRLSLSLSCCEESSH